MAIDMSQFYQVFFEESAEHLNNMESLLLGLDVANPDAEDLNAIFRAAHSIKGSSGTFGFTDLAEVTHVLENLLDRIRKGELALRPEMIDAFLDAGDVLKDLLAAHRGDGSADPAQVAAMCRRLSDLTGDAAAPSAKVAVPQPADAAAGALEASFVLELDGEAAQAAVDNLVAELGEQWPVSIIGRSAGPDQPWRLSIGAGADPESVRGLLEFVARSDSIRIGPAGAATEAQGDADGAYGFFDDAPVAQVAPAEETAYGFFDDAPAVPAVAEPAPDAGIKAGSEGDGFGFFVDVPAPAPEAPAAAPVVATQTVAKQEAPKRAARPAAGGETSIRVDVEKVDQLINLVGELVITQAMLAQSASVLDPVEFERLHNGLGQLERNTRDLQESVMSIRMMPISVVFSRFPRVVRDLA